MFKFLKHLFIPHARNNHRAKILHNGSLATILSIVVILNLAWYVVNLSRPDILGVSYSISESELLSLVNKERVDRGLSPLQLNGALSDAARRKAADMIAKNYWAHFSPDGSTSPWGFIRAAGYNYTFAGENLARGFTDSSSTVNAWMNSQSHRDNLLSAKYNDVGFAIVPGTLTGEETVLIVEMFGSTSSRTLASVQQIESPPASPSSVQGSSEAKEEPKEPEIQPLQTKTEAKAKIDSGVTSRALSTVGLTFLSFAFIMDLVIVERRKIPRIVGHNLDHLMLIIGFLIFFLLQRGGHIL